MNKRILELRTQAAAWVAENHQPQDPNAYSQKEIDQRYLMYEEKFAELIVQECEQVSLKVSHRDDDMGAIIARLIRKHFGIEE